MKKVLFVCTGNTCRSSMAEALARKILVEKNKEAEIDFASAGLYAMQGDKASPQAIKVMGKCGIDLTSHEARQVSREIIDEADIILTMTSSHKNQIMRVCPEALHKVHTLIEYVDGTKGDIADPFGGPVEIYSECAKQLEKYLRKAIYKILNS